MNKHAQLAVETLLIYGVAILIVMLAIGALIGFGVLDLSSLLPPQCNLGELTCETYVVNGDNAQFEFRNNLGRNIESFKITIKGEGNNEGLWQTPGDPPVMSCEGSFSGFVYQGSLTDPPVTVPCDIKVPSGKVIEGTLTANISFVGSNLPSIIKGKIRQKVS